jgi:hypothetical protein
MTRRPRESARHTTSQQPRSCELAAAPTCALGLERCASGDAPGKLAWVGQTTFHGRLVWVTGEQGGRSSGPPTTEEYRVTGYVPPHTVNDGLASFWLRDFAPGEWQSSATGRWLAVENEGPQELRPGSIVVVTEGARTVAYFHVDDVDDGNPRTGPAMTWLPVPVAAPADCSRSASSKTHR